MQEETSTSGHSAYDYQFICQTVGSLYLDWLNTRRQSEAVYAPRIESLQTQVSELISENEKLKSSTEFNTHNSEEESNEQPEGLDEPEDG